MCLHLFRVLPSECSSYSIVNEQSFESVNNENLNTSNLSSNGKGKGKGVSEIVRPGKTKRWSNVKINWSCTIFFSKPIWHGFVLLWILGKFWSQILGSKYYIQHVVFIWPPLSILCNMVQQCWMILNGRNICFIYYYSFDIGQCCNHLCLNPGTSYLISLRSP